MKVIKTKKELAEALGVSRQSVYSLMKQPGFENYLAEKGIQLAGSSNSPKPTPVQAEAPGPAPAKATVKAPVSGSPPDGRIPRWEREIDGYIDEISGIDSKIEELQARIKELAQERQELMSIVKVLDICFVRPSETASEIPVPFSPPGRPSGDSAAPAPPPVPEPKASVDEPAGEALNPLSGPGQEKLREMFHSVAEEIAGPESPPEPEPPAGPERDGYDLWPKKAYDFYGKVFTEKDRKEFLRIKYGEYWGPAVLPEGETFMSLTAKRRKAVELNFRLPEFMSKPVADQVRVVFHQSHETQLMVADSADDEKWLKGDAGDLEIMRFRKDLDEWRTVCRQYYLRFVVHPNSREINCCTKEVVPEGEGERIKKETVERWEELRLKWLEYLPRDVQDVCFYDIPEYVLREHPDAWVNPETDRVEVRSPGREDLARKEASGEKLTWKEKVRLMDGPDLQEALDHYAEAIKKENDPEKKARLRERGLVARNEKNARAIKYGVSK